MKANTGYAEKNLTFLFFTSCKLILRLFSSFLFFFFPSPFLSYSLNFWHFLYPEGNILLERLLPWMP